MKLNLFFYKILNFLQSTEMLARPSKQLPGKWDLFEYYIEQESELNNVKEDQLKTSRQHWNIEFAGNEKYFHNSNLSVSLITSIETFVLSRAISILSIELVAQHGNFLMPPGSISNKRLSF